MLDRAPALANPSEETVLTRLHAAYPSSQLNPSLDRGKVIPRTAQVPSREVLGLLLPAETRATIAQYPEDGGVWSPGAKGTKQFMPRDEQADGSNYRDDSKDIADSADGSNYRDDDESASAVADGSNYRVSEDPSSRQADGTNYERDPEQATRDGSDD